jgi:uracil-DNA glycosylase family 4
MSNRVFWLKVGGVEMLKSQALQLLEEKILACNKCEELSDYRKTNSYQYVPGTGNPSAKVMFVGEAPGENEAKQGVPFCGKAGNLLTNIIKAAGWTREEVFIANTIKCRPPGNRDPEACEVANCRKFLDMQIRIIDPKFIVCLGRIASVYLLGRDADTPISDLRGRFHEYNNRKVVCTYHPAYVLHSQDPTKQREAKQAIWNDICPVIAALRGEALDV